MAAMMRVCSRKRWWSAILRLSAGCCLFGLTDKFYQENRRVQYRLDGVELDVDYWSQLEPYLEIEGDSWEVVDSMAEKLGFGLAEKKIFSTAQIYASAGIREKDYKIMTFEQMVKRDA